MVKRKKKVFIEKQLYSGYSETSMWRPVRTQREWIPQKKHEKVHLIMHLWKFSAAHQPSRPPLGPYKTEKSAQSAWAGSNSLASCWFSLNGFKQSATGMKQRSPAAALPPQSNRQLYGGAPRLRWHFNSGFHFRGSPAMCQIALTSRLPADWCELNVIKLDEISGPYL